MEKQAEEAPKVGDNTPAEATAAPVAAETAEVAGENIVIKPDDKTDLKRGADDEIEKEAGAKKVKPDGEAAAGEDAAGDPRVCI